MANEHGLGDKMLEWIWGTSLCILVPESTRIRVGNTAPSFEVSGATGEWEFPVGFHRLGCVHSLFVQQHQQ